MNKVITIVCLSLQLCACLIMGETVAKLTGSIVDTKKQPYTNCSIDLLVGNDTGLQALKYRKRQLIFEATGFKQNFILKASQQTYVVEILCEGAADSYRSPALVLDEGIDKPIDLGQIILKRESSDH